MSNIWMEIVITAKVVKNAISSSILPLLLSDRVECYSLQDKMQVSLFKDTKYKINVQNKFSIYSFHLLYLTPYRKEGYFFKYVKLYV